MQLSANAVFTTSITYYVKALFTLMRTIYLLLQHLLHIVKFTHLFFVSSYAEQPVISFTMQMDLNECSYLPVFYKKLSDFLDNDYL